MILVTGSRGFVGSRVMAMYKDAVAVPSALYNDYAKLEEYITEMNPEVLIHTAAISDMSECEKRPEDAYVANVLLAEAIAKITAKTGTKLLAFSSDQVYTGLEDKGPYNEDMELPPPPSVYGKTKVEMEKRVLAANPDAVLLRAEWMYDMPLYGNDKNSNILMGTIRKVMRGEKLSFSGKEYRGVTYVRQVVELLEKMAKLPGGIYNYGSENPLNAVDTVKELCKVLNIAAEVEDNGKDFHNLWIDGSKLRANGIFFDTTVEGFSHCAKDYGL